MTTRARLAYQTLRANLYQDPSGWWSNPATPQWSVDSFSLDGPSGATWTDNGDGTFSSFMLKGSVSATNTIRIKFRLDNFNDIFPVYNNIDYNRVWLRLSDFAFKPNISTSGFVSDGVACRITVSNGAEWNGSPPSLEPRTYNFQQEPFPTTQFLGTQNNFHYIGQNVQQEVETNLGTKEYEQPNIAVFGGSTYATQRPFDQINDPDVLYIEYNFFERLDRNYDFTVTVAPEFTQTHDNAPQFYRWYANAFFIDGLEGDTFDPIKVNTDLIIDARYKHIASSSMSASSAVSESSANRRFCPPVAMASTSTLTITPSFILGDDITLDSRVVFQGTTENFVRMDPLTINAGPSTVQANLAFKLSTADVGIDVDVATNFGSNMIYDIFTEYTWDSFNLNTYFELGFVDGKYSLEEGEYTWLFLDDFTWDDWPTISWIGNESSWDNWPDDVWDRKYKIESENALAFTPTLKLGQPIVVDAEVVFDSDPGFNISAPLTEMFVDTAVPNAQATGVISVSIAIDSVFADAVVGTGVYDQPISISGAFNATLTANLITDFTTTESSRFQVSVIATKKITNVVDVDVDTDVVIVPTFKPAGFADLSAFTQSTVFVRLNYSTDPYNIFEVLGDNRVIVVPEENKQTKIDQENRLNIISAESRAYLVPEETRRLKLKIPPFKDRFATPKVRAEI